MAPSSASRTRNRVIFAAVAAFAVVLGTGSARAQAAAGAAPVVDPPSSLAPRGPALIAERLPNPVLKSHDGKLVRFFDDLVKDKIVMINFMYATCKGR
jgi:protein SCO1